MKYQILYLDDNLEHLLLIKEMLGEEYNVFCTHKPEIAFEILEKEKINAVISDFNMPEITGIDFFAQIEKTHPSASRILLTAYSSTDLAVNAFKEGNVFDYITKPVVYEKLIITIKNAVNANLLQQKIENKRIKELRLKEMLSAIFENSPNILILADSEGIVHKVNKKGLEIFGNQPPLGDLIGSSLQCTNSFEGLGCGKNPECKDCVLRNSLECTYKTKQNILNKEGKMIFIVDNKKEERHFLFSTSIIHQKNIEFVLISLVDITENKQIVKALAKTENRYQSLFENMTSAFALHEIITNEKGVPIDYRFLEVNQAFELLTGLKKENILNKTVLEVMPNTELDWIEAYGKVALTSEAIHFEKFSQEIGKFYEVSAYSPEPKLFATVFTEITERKIIEQTLSFTSKRSVIENPKIFFEETVKFLSQTLGMEHVFISKRTTNPNKVLTVAACINFSISKNINYDLTDKPYQKIFNKREGIFKPDLSTFFPDDDLLKEIKAESYVGYPLIDSSQDIIGHIAVLSNKQITNPDFVLEVLSLIAVRITSEMELNSYLSEKQNILRKLQQTVIERNEEIELRKEADKKLLNAVISTEENERSNFAREMHDGIGPQLSIINMYLNVLLNSNTAKENVEILEKAISILEEALHSVVEISHAMSPSVVKKNGLVYAIESFCKKIEHENTPKFILNLKLDQRLKYEVEFSLYRVCTELINNSLKYAKASKIEIELIVINNNISLSYADDGIGFDIHTAKSKTSGMGLENINTRIHALNGSVEINSKPNEGVHFKIVIPYLLIKNKETLMVKTN